MTETTDNMQSLCEKLRNEGYTTCDVADVLTGVFKLPATDIYVPLQMISPDRAQNPRFKLVGEAFTVQLVSTEATDAAKLPPGTHHVDAALPGQVIVISVPQDEETLHGTWGGLLTARAQKLNIRGTVSGGRVRDIVEFQDAAFPVFAKGITALSASPALRPSTIQKAVYLEKALVTPGDVIVADIHGVVIVPLQKVSLEDVLRECDKLQVRDGKCLDDVKGGEKLYDTFAQHRGSK